MTDRLRIGFIGCGDFATGWIWPCLRYAPIDVVYACARRPQRAERARKMFGAEQVTTDARKVFADPDVQAVFIIGPPPLHHELGVPALEAGKHVFIEKPAGDSLAQALELQAAADRNDVQCQVAFQKRFALAYHLARDVARRPEFGGVRLAKINYSFWRQPGWHDQLTMMGSHPLDLVRFFMGDAAESYVLKRSAPDGRNTCVVTHLYDDGSSAIVNMSASDPHVQEWIELSGANQLVSVHNLVEFRHWADGSDYHKTFVMNPGAVEVWHPEFAIPYGQADSMRIQGYAGEVVEFAEAILSGRPVSPSIADGVMAMRYAEAIDKAPEGMNRLEL
jgi:predicted dehydrogenase